MQRFGCRAVVMVAAVTASAFAQQYELVQIGAGGGSYSRAWDINERGVIAGHALNGQGSAVLWIDGQMVSLGLPPVDGFAQAVAVNEAGQVAVTVESNPQGYTAFLWDDGEWTEIGPLPGREHTIAEGIDEAGRVVGRSFILGNSSETGAFVWDDGVLTELEQLSYNASAYGVGPEGLVVGLSRVDLGSGRSQANPVIWENGVLNVLGLLPDETDGQAFAANAVGDVVGACSHFVQPFFTAYQATLWRADGRVVDLGLTPANRLACVDGFPFWTVNIAHGVNNHGDVVGYAHCLASGAAQAAFLWRDGVNHNLEDLVVNLGGWTLTSAQDINDDGLIVGYGIPAGTSNVSAFLLVPVFACDADFNGDGDVNTIDVLAFLNAWSVGDPAADFNGDGTVNTLDVLAFLNAWSGGC